LQTVVKSIGMVKSKTLAGQWEDLALLAITPRLRELVQFYRGELMKSTPLLLALSISLASIVSATIDQL
jgi:hypothetical protein